MVLLLEYYSSVKEATKQCLLVSFNIGNEGLLAGVFVLMAANLRALNVPLAYTSLPSFVAALVSGAMIAGLSLISEKYAISRRAKACILLSAVFFQYTGAVLVIAGNMIKLKCYEDQAPVPYTTGSQITEDALRNNSLSLDQSSMTSFSEEIISTFAPGTNRSNCNSSLCQEEISPQNFDAEPTHNFPLHTFMVMVGFTLLEGSYDPVNCFLKTFALACIPPDSHSTVLVKASSITSIGGILITLLGSMSVGGWLFGDSTYDANAAKTVSLIGIAFVVSILTLTVSLLIGIFSCGGGEFREVGTETSRHEVGTADEKRTLLPETDINNSAEENIDLSWSVSIALAHSVLEQPSYLADEVKSAVTKAHDKDKVYRRGQVPSSPVSFLKQHSFTVILCAATFFASSGYFVFDMFSVNFVSIAIFKGDPTSPTTSEEFSNFMRGQEAASSAITLFYVTCLAIGFFENAVLEKVGWWVQTAVVSITYTIVSFSCGYFSKLWLYYLTACLTGAIRLLLYVIPLVLITKDSPKRQATGDAKGSSFGSRIALITAMFPLSFLVGAGIMGPLLSWTRNEATPMFTTTSTTAVALVLFWLIRKH